MHEITRRVLELVTQLESAQIRYGWEYDPDFAVLLKWEDARELYHDLIKGMSYEIYAYLPADPPRIERKYDYHPMLAPPPRPDGKHVVWCELHGIKLGIKGQEDT